MEMEEYELETDMLRDILEDITEMIITSRQDRQNLIERAAKLESDFNCQKLTKLAFGVEIEQLHRSRQDTGYTLRNLEHQRKLTIETIEKFRKLE